MSDVRVRYTVRNTTRTVGTQAEGNTRTVGVWGGHNVPVPLGRSIMGVGVWRVGSIHVVATWFSLWVAGMAMVLKMSSATV